MSSWYDRAVEVIAVATLPVTATVDERQKALRAAYPFGERAHFPYKAWCKAQSEYLRRYEPASGKHLPLLSPLERARRRAGVA